MEKLEIISLVCTFGVVACGLTVIVAATVRVIRDILKTYGTRVDDLLPAPQPMWTHTVTEIQEPLKRKRRTRNPGPRCPHCDGDISEAQVIGSETTDEKTVLTKECPSCKKEIKVDA